MPCRRPWPGRDPYDRRSLPPRRRRRGAADDAEFAGYLRNRARDLLSNDYESGDAAWVTGRSAA